MPQFASVVFEHRGCDDQISIEAMEFLTLNESLFGIAIAILTYHIWMKRHIYRFALSFPSAVWGIPPLGAFIYIRKLENLLPYINRLWRTQKARTTFFMISTTPFLITSDTAVIEQLLTRSTFLDKSQVIYSPVKDALYGGMIGMPGAKALKMRKLFAPVFRHKCMLSLMPIFNEKSRELLVKLNNIFELRGSTDELLVLMQVFTWNVTRTTTMGHMDKSSPIDESQFMKRLVFAFHHTVIEIMLNCAKLRWLIKFNPYYKYIKWKLYSFSNELIKQRQRKLEFLEPNNSVPVSTDENGSLNLFIDHALKHQRNGTLPWQAMVGEANGLIVASYETTSSTLYSTLLMLAMHPHIQDQVFDELLAVFPDKGNVSVEYEHFKELPYLDMVINETLRLFPPAPLIAREITRESSLLIEKKEYKIPPHMHFMIDTYSVQRDPTIWGEYADFFNPDHFLPHNIMDRSPFAFIPFSKGPRICLGWTYAYFVLKVALAQILRQYKFTTTSKYKDVRVITTIFLEYNMNPKPVVRIQPR